ncbi:MAG TPA: hypothetical protein VHL78_11755 [Actinomycetota bacterium]|nr:hypothetical protein [Actinomycetota bacterium]
MIDERQVREMLERRAETISATPTDEPNAIRRARRRLARNATVGAVMALAVVAGAVATGLRVTQATPPPVRPATPPPAPAGPGALAYARDGDIYVAEWDGSNAVRIADGRSVSECGGNGEYWAVGPMWSPDGRYLAYRHQNCPLRSEEDPSGVVITDPEGNVVAEVPSAEFGQNLGGWRISWSPDSTRFATWVTYVDVAAPDGTKLPVGETIGVFGLDGARHALLSVRPFLEYFEVDPMWLPDGESLLVGDVVVPIDGRTPSRLQLDGSPPHGVMVTYSPDGSRLAYVHEVDAPGQNRLLVAEADGSDPQAVFFGAEGGVVWSPAGDRIAFTSRKAGTDHLNELRVVDLDTGTVTLLADWSDREADYFQTLWPLDFSPEGDRILFGVPEGKGALWSVNVDGSDLRRLVAGTHWGDWLPPGAER